MPIQFWQCCGRNLTPNAVCKKCGKTRPTVGFVDEPEKVKKPITKDKSNV